AHCVFCFPLLFLLYSHGRHRYLHSFPTRRSSDLTGDFEGLFGDLGPPGGPLWEYILNWINPWPQDSHSDANALGDAWMDAANAVEALIQQAGAAASAIATQWPAAAGQMYVQRTRTFTEPP